MAAANTCSADTATTTPIPTPLHTHSTTSDMRKFLGDRKVSNQTSQHKNCSSLRNSLLLLPLVLVTLLYQEYTVIFQGYH